MRLLVDGYISSVASLGSPGMKPEDTALVEYQKGAGRRRRRLNALKEVLGRTHHAADSQPRLQ